ncbi:MAG TPA: LysR family transcriptional regulator [Azospirillaceae bacterium]|nr:LysR family transcriptional regulator [Azospirillaceae bacterium]
MKMRKALRTRELPALWGQWDNLATLQAIRRHGGVLPAARQVGLNVATVSRRVGFLQEEVGAKLIERTRTGTALTPEGMIFADTAASMEALVERALRQVGAGGIEIVTIAATQGLLANWVVPRLAGFLFTHSGVTVETLPGNAMADLASGEADIALRFGPLPNDPELKVHARGVVRIALFAARAYLDRYGMPKGLDDLAGHRLCYRTSDKTAEWFRPLLPWTEPPAVVVGSSEELVAAVRGNVGVVAGPSYLRHVLLDVVMLPIQVGEPIPLSIVTHARTSGRPAVHQLVEHLKQEFIRDRGEWFS